MNKPLITVAIADDHILYLNSLAAVVESIPGYRVTICAANGKELIEKVSVSFSPDIVLLDMSMPQMDGLQTLAVLQKKLPRTKVLVISGYSHNGAVLQMIRQGANGYISKNCGPDQIAEALKAVWERGVYFPDHSELLKEKNTGQSWIDMLENLSEREITFLQLASCDLSSIEIAERMEVSRTTLCNYRENLYSKFQVQTRHALVMMALRYNVISVEFFVPGYAEPL